MHDHNKNLNDQKHAGDVQIYTRAPVKGVRVSANTFEIELMVVRPILEQIVRTVLPSAHTVAYVLRKGS
jgi:hypothetical protein